MSKANGFQALVIAYQKRRKKELDNLLFFFEGDSTAFELSPKKKMPLLIVAFYWLFLAVRQTREEERERAPEREIFTYVGSP